MSSYFGIRDVSGDPLLVEDARIDTIANAKYPVLCANDARALHRARQNGSHVLLTDWQNIAHTDLESADAFFLALSYMLADQLNLDTDPADAFLPKRAPSSNFERFLLRQVFPVIEKPIVWGIDEADRLFACDYCDNIFGMLRAWHNERALDPDGPWKRFSIILAYSTEANLFIRNMNQSPFNVGTRVTLHDLTLEQVGQLNQRYGTPLPDPAACQRLYALVGGHPYLIRRSLDTMQRQGLTITSIELEANRDDGIFCDHLERMRFALQMDEALTDTVRRFFQEGVIPDQKDYVRLSAAGIMTGSSPAEMKPRCELYNRFLRRHLL